ncbi:hypothetical protein E2C01_030739 [Portunus trituberculatus]|uniref:Uncharacterized protein n=1 Tax=Portunus trituberculatus TaxID=210409 RepID=A0A5B7EV14_PORTR|nr:hypothetical protein [Portunus trituberculatus]
MRIEKVDGNRKGAVFRRLLLRSVSPFLRSLDLRVLVADIFQGPLSWKLPMPVISITPTAKSDPSSVQLQLAMEHVVQVSSSVTAPHCLYTDGLLKTDDAALGAVFLPHLPSPSGSQLPGIGISSSLQRRCLWYSAYCLFQRQSKNDTRGGETPFLYGVIKSPRRPQNCTNSSRQYVEPFCVNAGTIGRAFVAYA